MPPCGQRTLPWWLTLAWPVTCHDPGREIQVTVCQSPLCNLFALDFFLPPWEQLASESGSLFQNEKILREGLNPTNSLKPGPAEPKQAWSKKFVPIYLQIYEIFRNFCLFVWDFFFLLLQKLTNTSTNYNFIKIPQTLHHHFLICEVKIIIMLNLPSFQD